MLPFLREIELEAQLWRQAASNPKVIHCSFILYDTVSTGIHWQLSYVQLVQAIFSEFAKFDLKARKKNPLL